MKGRRLPAELRPEHAVRVPDLPAGWKTLLPLGTFAPFDKHVADSCELARKLYAEATEG